MIAVVAATKPRAEQLARELNIARSLPIGARTVNTAVRGLQLDAVVSEVPLSAADLDVVCPALLATGGQVYQIGRVS
ncbi:hypothetical protein SEA_OMNICRITICAL_2 [Mycobacterium phage OmniCritical]|uniref:Uncharacterized protein n=2 Tax=Fionnbharthvirus TaxID=2948708 RepID=A0A1J0MD94_9CAUD|nr:hypothetical protein PBI_CHEETOBRO_2 [Mycobacterium phage Cheetobro]YP_009950439.1 hypothetical protein I5G70_gp02 [Mycobacterium phage Taquito]ALA46274.1 hypothetical protein PBI_SLARP_2 [Mycobacterium phage Slarp]APD19138.1 hypothetical protein SEA_MITTI_2 [Mycobacterium phage Mitti]ASW31655.1 hypothetical protein SEA_CHANCELLOR_2 [Mycobacterium phage Chancellor]AVR77321.1 hypothetical protein SEA_SAMSCHEPPERS_2 [Mycobacterium phage SamScheppers]UUG69693.1 hypothetical protein SEA_OMNICR